MELSEEFRIAVDVGGTFTDCIIVDKEGNRIGTKSLTTPKDPSEGVINALEIAASLLKKSISAILKNTISFVHGTTVGTNVLTTRSGARTGLLMTSGHEQAILIGRVRQKVTGLSEREKTHVTHLTKADPGIVGIEDIRGITERVDSSGNIIVPLDLKQAEIAIDDLVASGVESLAVCFLWSFLCPEHELAVANLVRTKYPNIFITLSSEISPRLGEYERCVSTVFNSYIAPYVGDYINRLERKLNALGLQSALLVIQSNGGLGTVKSVLGRPLLIVDSGPAGGILGAQYITNQVGSGNILCADIGGTTFDIGLIYENRIQMDSIPTIGKYAYLIPKIFVKSIGAGGGSIAWMDQGGSLRVGPQSAGSLPGPAAYGLGGTQPTVTDALVVLGYLDPSHLLGRTIKINSIAADGAFTELGQKLNMSAVQAAAAVLQISNAQMVDLARKVTVERGLDPRDFALLTYGGAGSLFSAFIAREIGAKFSYIPAESGVFSAFGMLTTDISFQEERSINLRTPLTVESLSYVNKIICDLENKLMKRFNATDLLVDKVKISRSVDMRFAMQIHELNVDIATPTLSKVDFDKLEILFTGKYESTYGKDSAYTAAGFEYVTLKVTGTLINTKPIQVRSNVNSKNLKTSSIGSRMAFFPVYEYIETEIYDGELLNEGDQLIGPAIIQRVSDTVVIPPDFQGNVDSMGGITIV